MKYAVLRVFTGFMVAGVTITCVHLGSYGFLFYILALNLLGLMEFYRLFRSATLLPRVLPGIISSTVFIFSVFFSCEWYYGYADIVGQYPVCFFDFCNGIIREGQKSLSEYCHYLFGCYLDQRSIEFVFNHCIFTCWFGYLSLRKSSSVCLLYSGPATAELFFPGRRLGKTICFTGYLRIKPGRGVWADPYLR